MKRLLLSILLASSLLYSLNQTLGYSFSPLQVLVVMAGVLFLYSLIFFHLYTKVVFLGLGFFLGLWGAWQIKAHHLAPQIWSKGQSLYDQAFTSLTDGSGIDPASEKIFFILFAFLLGFWVFWTCVKHSSCFSWLLLGTGFFLLPWCFDLPMSLYSFYLFCLGTLLYFFESQYKKSFFGLSLAVFFLAFFFTQRIPLSLRWVDEKIDPLIQWDGKQWGIQPSAVSYKHLVEEENIGGDNFLDSTIVMEVKASRPLYLRSGSKDIYTGQGWKMDENRKKEEENIEQWLFDGAIIPELESYFEMDEMAITLKNISTSYLFVPLGTTELTLPSEYEYQVSHKDTLEVSPLAKEGFSYKLKAYTPKHKEEFFKDHLRQASVSSPPSPQWLQLPSTLPQRVKDLAFSITEGLEHPYDQVKALEQYVARQHTYTLQPAPTPEGQDVVDFFLFESKEGYCTYYASALVVLARSLGIPARYVEGYVLPSSPSWVALGESRYVVRNEQAHAWVEVWFDGLGWVGFEPTTPFETRYNHEEPSPQKEEAEKPESTVVTPSPTPVTTPIQTRQVLPFFGLVLVALCFFLFFYSWKIRKKRTPANLREAIVEQYVACLFWLEALGYPLQMGETPWEYAQRVAPVIEEMGIPWLELTQDWMKVRYSLEPLSKEVFIRFQKNQSLLKERVKGSLGQMRYITILGKSILVRHRYFSYN
ncbi:MAG: transglutaminase domain-containing protein [Epulopiscium sp.]|nr:transglutaminase domain-containing protein [Candidatus Epulonipiscium sp.]